MPQFHSSGSHRWLKVVTTVAAISLLVPALGLVCVLALPLLAPLGIVALPFMVPAFFPGASEAWTRDHLLDHLKALARRRAATNAAA